MAIIETILKEVFDSNIDEAISKLIEYDFYAPMEQIINRINTKLENKDINQIEVVAISFLQTVNTKINAITCIEDMLFLKKLIADIGSHLILKYFRIDGVTHKNLESLISAFKSIAEVQGYDYADIERRLGIEKSISFIKAKHNQKCVYYDWCLKQADLEFFIDDLKSDKIVSSKKELATLFTKTPQKVRFNRKDKEYIFILFDTLYEQKIIKPKLQKGQFKPLVNNSVDFEKEILFEKEPNKIKYTIKKNERKHQDIKERIHKRFGYLFDAKLSLS